MSLKSVILKLLPHLTGTCKLNSVYLHLQSRCCIIRVDEGKVSDNLDPLTHLTQNSRHFTVDTSNAFSWIKMLEIGLKFHWSSFLRVQLKLEQLERLRSEDTPRRLMIAHTIESCWIPSQNKVEWPWRYRSRSKVITCDTPSHASDHLYQIWKESIRNCRCYRADTIFNAKAKWPWRYRSRSKVIICNTFSHTSDHLC